MKIGTKSLLYGYHQFLIHPLLVAWSWYKLYGFPWDPRLWVAFVVHDWGYWGKADMDGPEGERHVHFGAGIMGFWFDEWHLRHHCRWVRHFAWLCNMLFGVGHFRRNWYCFTFYHSRFISRYYDVEPSRLCWADKRVIAATPTWLQLLLMRLTGEWREYMHHDGSNGRTPGLGKTQRQWCEDMRQVCREQVAKNSVDPIPASGYNGGVKSATPEKDSQSKGGSASAGLSGVATFQSRQSGRPLID